MSYAEGSSKASDTLLKAAGPDFLHGLRPCGTHAEACHGRLVLDLAATAMGIAYVHLGPPCVMTGEGMLVS